jgi:hypothetical protein
MQRAGRYRVLSVLSVSYKFSLNWKVRLLVMLSERRVLRRSFRRGLR